MIFVEIINFSKFRHLTSKVWLEYLLFKIVGKN